MCVASCCDVHWSQEEGCSGTTPQKRGSSQLTEQAVSLFPLHTPTLSHPHRGSTPLHLAVRMGHKDVVEVLVKNGANVCTLLIYSIHIHCSPQVNVRNEAGDTPLDIASELGLSQLQQLLVDNGAEHPVARGSRENSLVEKATPTSGSAFPEEVINGVSEDESQLLEAARSGNLDLVKVCCTLFVVIY